MKFPDVCPFTGVSKLGGRIQVSGSRTQLFLPIPFVGWFSVQKAGRISFPACAVIAWGEKVLTLLSWLGLIVGFVGFFCLVQKGKAQGIWNGHEDYFIGGGLAAFYLFKIIRWLALSRVRIARVGMGGLEVRFASEQYAREFARMNDLHASDHRSKKRAMPVAVNELH
jgi:hypothetical protein